MEPNNNGLPIKLVLIAFILVIVGGCAYYFYFYKNTPIEQTSDQDNTTTMNTFRNQYLEASELASSGKIDEAIMKLSSLAENTPNSEEGGKVKIMLAGNLFSRNSDSDRVTAINLYKEVINDATIPPYVRALALNNVANIVKGQNESFYRLYFTDDYFKDLMPTEGTQTYKTNKAYLNILEKSDQIFPNSYAKYSIAGNYYAPALAEVQDNTKNERLDNMRPTEAAEIMARLIAEGDELDDEYLHVKQVNIQKYLYRAIAINTAGRILGHDIEKRESGYRFALLKGAEIAENDEKSLAILLRIRLFYANFIFKYKDENEYDAIRELLIPFREVASSNSYSATNIKDFYKNIVTGEESHVLKPAFQKFVEISDDFRVFTNSVSQ